MFKIRGFSYLLNSIFGLLILVGCNSASNSDLAGLADVDESTPGDSTTGSTSGGTSGGGITVGDPYRIRRTAGNAQSKLISTTLDDAFEVQVQDDQGLGVPNVSVTFLALNAGATFSESAAVSRIVLTDSSGYATATGILSGTSGAHVFSASIPTTTSPVVSTVNFTATAVAGGASSTPDVIELFSGQGQTCYLGNNLSNPLVAIVKDASGDPVSGVTVTFTTSTANAQIISGGTAVSNSFGLATSTVRCSTTVTGTNTFRATMPTGTTTFVDFTANASESPGPSTPDVIARFSGNGQMGALGATLSNAIVARVTNSAGNPVSGVNVTFSAITANAAISSATTVSTDSAGLAQATATLSTTVSGDNIFRATIASGSTTQVNFTMTAEASSTPDKITRSTGNSQVGIKGATLANPLVVRVLDSSNQPVSGVNVVFSTSTAGALIQDPGAGASYTVTSDSSGYAQATVRLSTTAGSNTFTATIPSGTTTSVNFTATGQNDQTILRIARIGSSSAIGATSVFIGDTPFDMRAILVTATGGTFVKEIAASWSTSGGILFPDIAVSGGGLYADYDPSAEGQGTITAMITDPQVIIDENIIATSALTGTLTASLSLTPSSISISSGNAQSSTAGSLLSSPFRVLVRNASATPLPVPGVSVRCTASTSAAIQGGSGNPSTLLVTTDSNGIAECYGILAPNIATSNSFTFSIPSNGSITPVTFTASGLAGAANKLAITQQPSGASIGSAFPVQPVIQVQDANGNHVNTDSGRSIVVSIKSPGAGTLGGTTSISTTGGTAAFTNVSNSTGQTGLVLTFSSTGLTGVDSAAFDVLGIQASSQCCAVGNAYCGTATPAGFQTIDGGCKDLNGGLVWSSRASSTYTWNQAVWGQGSNATYLAKTNNVNLGLTTDVDPSQPGYFTADTSGNAGFAYCQQLVENGFSDWRLPTVWEMSGSRSNGLNTAAPDTNFNYWTSTPWSAGNSYYFNIFSGVNSGGALSTLYSVRCVRNASATKIMVQQQPAGGANGLGRRAPISTLPVFKIADATDSTVGSSIAAVTITPFKSDGSAASGQLCILNTGTGRISSCANSITVNAVNGIVTPNSGLVYTAAEAIYFRATSTGLTSVNTNTITFNATYPLATCKAIGGPWINGNGGCKETSTGLIYSSMSTGTMSWNDYVWDQSASGNGGTQDVFDSGFTNDYDVAYPAFTGTDGSATNYCHDLEESGYYDWFAIPLSQRVVSGINGRNPAVYLNYSSVFNWLSATQSAGAATTAYASAVPADAGAIWAAKTTAYRAICIRRDPPSQIAFSTLPANPTRGLGAGFAFETQPIVHVRDSNGVGPLFRDASTVTLSHNGTGQLCLYDANHRQYSCDATQSVTAVNGVATFANVGYSKGNETIILTATATGTWQGNAYSLSTTTSLIFPAVNTNSRCAAASEGVGWQSTNGGCRDLNASGLVWTPLLVSGVTWHDAIWDSTVPGAPAAVGAITNDYGNSAGASPDISGTAICRSLNWNGFTDWRLPTSTEFTAAIGRSGGSALGFAYHPNTWFWTSTTNATAANANVITITGASSSGLTSMGKTCTSASTCFGGGNFGPHVRCVRTPP
jgi:hypothetical protein